MHCPACGSENESGRKFCLSCGHRLAVVCPACGTANTPGARFCGECGSAMAEADGGAVTVAAGPGPEVPATERRLVSVLFADLVGFTTLSEARDAEDVRDLLTIYFDTCRSIVERYGGTIEKFIGDAVMAVWGTPTAQEDDAERAVRAALELVDAVRRLGAERATPELALRAAVHTGEAVVTIGAAGMGMVAGDLVNTASRLQSVAQPATVLVGEGTHRAAGNAIVFEPAGDHDLKGKAAPVAAYRAVRVVAQRGGVGRSEGLEPPFVGRESELQLIKDFYHATARDPEPRLVSVVGQAGIGKSRLAWEFLKYIDGVTEVVYWHQGRSPAYGEGISFWALGEMVRMRIGIGEGADETTTRERLGASLEEFVADPDERRALTEPLLHLLGIGDGSTRDRGQLFRSWRTFFERIAEKGPVAMVFEDLQWADAGLLDFIDEVVTWSRGRSIYIITLARPELLDRRPNWGAGQRSFTSLGLRPLADDAMRELLAGLVDGLPETAVDQIVARAEGVPLYAVETVRMLLNDGRIVRSGDAFRPVGDVTSVAVPESLHALIAARIDALPAGERTLVQDASVLGLSFAAPALEAVARSGPDDIEPMLQHLVQREIFTIDDDPRSPERGQHRFVQGLLREVAYGTLSRDDRRARHLAAARYYEALGDDELSGVLAQHYLDAYQAHPEGAEGAAMAAQARVALRGAAQRAADLGSFRLARSYLESALDVTTVPAEELDLRVLATNAAAGAGQFDSAVAHGERAIELAASLGLDHERRLATARLADILLEGHQQRAIQLLTAAIEEAGLTSETPGYLELATVLAKAEMRQMHDARAVELADQALSRPEGPGEEPLVLDLLITRSVALSNLGRATEAVVTLSGALEVADRLNREDAFNRASVNLGYALAPDDPARAFAVSKAAIERSKRAGVVWTIRYILGNAADSAVEVGEWDWALGQIAELDSLFTEPAEQLWFGVFRSVIASYRGGDTLADAQRLHELGAGFDDPQYRSLGLYPLAVAHLLRGETAPIFALAEQDHAARGVVGADTSIYGARAAIWADDVAGARRMQTLFESAAGGRRNDALRKNVAAGVAMLEGRPAEARSLFADAQRAFRELGTPFWLALTDLDIVVTGAMQPDERRRAATEAREIFEGLRATALLGRLASAEAAAGASVHAEAPRVPAEVSQEA